LITKPARTPPVRAPSFFAPVLPGRRSGAARKDPKRQDVDELCQRSPPVGPSSSKNPSRERGTQKETRARGAENEIGPRRRENGRETRYRENGVWLKRTRRRSRDQQPRRRDSGSIKSVPLTTTKRGRPFRGGAIFVAGINQSRSFETDFRKPPRGRNRSRSVKLLSPRVRAKSTALVFRNVLLYAIF